MTSGIRVSSWLWGQQMHKFISAVVFPSVAEAELCHWSERLQWEACWRLDLSHIQRRTHTQGAAASRRLEEVASVLPHQLWCALTTSHSFGWQAVFYGAVWDQFFWTPGWVKLLAGTDHTNSHRPPAKPRLCVVLFGVADLSIERALHNISVHQFNSSIYIFLL